MNFSLDTAQTRSLNNLDKNDLIQFESQYIDLDYYVVFSIEKDLSIPAILLQLWKFQGGYDHAFVNVMENDLGLNKQVAFYNPKKVRGTLKEITTYRSDKSNLSKKEEVMFDVWPDEVSSDKNQEFPLPFEANIEIENSMKNLVLPSWTPLQRLPLEKITEGTELEIWIVEEMLTVMRVIKI